jgi:hypothetical protein
VVKRPKPGVLSARAYLEVSLMFSTFPQSDIDIVAPDGTIRARTKAILDSKLATIPDPSILIEAGDEIRRSIPSGAEEAFEVVDPVYHEDFHGIPAHYQVKIKRKGQFPQGKGGNYNFYVSGTNARVNFQSQDYSTNIVANHKVFGELREAIHSGITDVTERQKLTALTEELEQNVDNRGAFTRSYQNFITSAANHMTLVAPFLPALTGFLTHGS